MSWEDGRFLLYMLYIAVMLGIPFCFILYRRDRKAKADRVLDALNNRRLR